MYLFIASHLKNKTKQKNQCYPSRVNQKEWKSGGETLRILSECGL